MISIFDKRLFLIPWLKEMGLAPFKLSMLKAENKQARISR
jgi:hypothetical protein